MARGVMPDAEPVCLDGPVPTLHCDRMPWFPENPVALAQTVTIVATMVLACTSCQSRFETHARTVTATAYTLRAAEGGFHGQAGVGAWGAQLADHSHSIAVSRDLLAAGLTRGRKVWIDGLDGTWVVRDKMNRRWKNRIDILMDDDPDVARQWGRRKVTIRWYTRAPED